MKRISNNTELAVIFQRETRENGPTIFWAYAVVPGSLNKQTMTFTTWNGTTYSHILIKGEEYGFAIRTTIGRINKYYKKKTLNSLCRAYLKDLQLDFFYYTTSDNITFKDLTLITEDRQYHTTYSEYDPDLDRIVKKKLKSEKSLQEEEDQIDTKKLIQEIKGKVIGQDDAIEDIVSTLWQNSKSQKKNNLLLIGPTGVGKTQIIRELSQIIDVPMVVVDASSLTQTGFEGESVENALKNLLYSCDKDIAKAEKGIIVLDEIDKLSNSANSGEKIATTGVQYELLKLLEDGDYYLNIGNDINPQIVHLNTNKIMIIGAGAFSDMKKIKQQTGKKLGFYQEVTPTRINSTITTDDLIQYGLIPELVGRFAQIIELSNLSEENLIQIMKNPQNSPLKTKLHILESIGVKTQISESVYEKIAQYAIEKKTGARGLDSAINSLFIKAMNEISQNPKTYQELIIDEKVVENPCAYRLVRKK